MSRFANTLMLRLGAGAIFALAIVPLLSETAAATTRPTDSGLGSANPEALYAQRKGEKGVKGQSVAPPKGTTSRPPKGTTSRPPKGVSSPPPKGTTSRPPKGTESPPPKGTTSRPPKGSTSSPPRF